MLDIAFKQRIVGAIFILSLGVILIPVILETPAKDTAIQYSIKPQTPTLPKTQGVAQINYVFNDMETNFEKPAEVIPDVPREAVELPKVEPAPAAPVVVPKKEAPAAPKKESPKAPVKVVEAPKKPVEALSEKTKPTLTVKKGPWTVQLGAFSNRDNAKNLQTRLAKAGFDAYVKEVPGSALVRVYVASGVERDDAQGLLTKLDAQYGLKGIIVKFRES